MKAYATFTAYPHQFAEQSQHLPTSLLFLDEVTSNHVAKEPYVFIPSLFLQSPFFDYLLEFSIDSVTDLGLYANCGRHRDTLPGCSFQAGLAVQLWGVKSADSLQLSSFSGPASVAESHFT